MSKTFETTVQINGAIGGSLNSSFKSASSGLKDLSSRARAVQQEMNRLGSDYRKGTIHQSQYAESTAKLSRELKQLEGTQRRVNALKSTYNNTMSKTKAVAGGAAVGSAVAATAVAVSSLNTAADFEAQMAKVGAKTEASKAEMQALNKEALRLGASSSLSSSQVAVAMDELGAKGMDANKIIAAMPGLIAATEASGEDLTLVSNVVTSAINAYGMEASEASRVADVMAMSANKTAAGVGDLGYSFKYAAPVANTLGIKLEELAASTGILVDKGLAGEQAGTALRMALVRLSKPPTEAEKALKKLNITAVDSKGNFKSLAQLSTDWEKSTAKLSDTQKVQYASTIFGTEAATAMLSLFESGPKKLSEMTTALENSGGAAAKAAAIMKDNYAGSKEQMFGALESAQIAFATPALDVLKDTFDGVSSMIEKNMGGIENAGKATAKVLRDITAPFSTQKPIKPKITPDMDPTDAKNMMVQYNKELQKYEMFNDMGFGEKIDYMLDTTTQKAEAWLGGSGGEAMGRIFTKLGTIAGKAWIAGLTGAASGALSSAMEGNFSGALGLGAAAWMLGGGTLMKGAIGAGRWAMEKRGGKGGKKENKKDSAKGVESGDLVSTSTESKKKSKGKNSKNTSTNASTGGSKGKKPIFSSIWDTGKGLAKGGGNALSTAGKWAGKAVAPVGIALGISDIFKSSDKVKTAGETAGGGLGGWGGAALGTAIMPGIGTLIGGAAGYFGGKYLGGKAVDTARGSGEVTQSTPEPMRTLAPRPTLAPNPTPVHGSTKQASPEAAKSLDTTKLNESANKLATTLETTNTAFTPIATSAPLIGQNMTTLATSLVTTNTAFTAISTSAPLVGQTMTTLTGSFTELQTSASTTAANMGNLTMYTGLVSTDFVTSFYSLKAATDQSTSNMSSLAAAIASASGMFNMQGIQTATQGVIAALNSLKTRIDNAQIPTGGGTTSRRTKLE
ncbi:phage tail tape measure protein [Lysinibacillus xylanilyticus]|uniref:phage tail tape measure protein n=1 Tax=Lysinibacillus xylanilyticus TaxID=582475 RepID=UPI0036DE4C18